MSSPLGLQGPLDLLLDLTYPTKLEGVYPAIDEQGRLMIPERVAREFIKNHNRTLAEMAQTPGNV